MILGSSSSSRKNNLNSKLMENIWLEIFLYLPLESIYELRCVSKVWLSLLSNPCFINRWIKHNCYDKSLPWLVYHSYNTLDFGMKFLITYPKSLSLQSMSVRQFITANEDGFSFRYLNSEPYPNRLYLLGSSNGLVLGASSKFRPMEYYVCNPLTKQWVALPRTPTSSTDAATGFTCESNLSNSCYKVVRIPEIDKNAAKFNIEVFSSDVGEWKVYDVARHKDAIGRGSRAYDLVIVSGILYWVECGNILAYNLNNNNVNVETGSQHCELMQCPGESNIYYLGESEGLLCYAGILKSQKTLGVWVFEEGWRLLHKDIDLRDLVSEMFKRFYVNDYEDWEGAESAEAYDYGEKKAIKDVAILGFNPVDKNVVLFSYDYGIWAFNIQTRRYEELVEPSFVAKMHSGYNFHNIYETRYRVYNSFALKPMPTILPPPTWKNTSGSMGEQGHGQFPAVGMVASAGQMPHGAVQFPSNQMISVPPVDAIQSPGQTAGFSASQAQLVQLQHLSYQQIQQQQQQQQQQQVRTFWANQYQDNEQTTNFKNHSLPLARIKKIMKADEDVKMIAAEAPVIFARACEMFISELTLRSWNHAEENKRKTLKKNDVAAAIASTDIFDFLVDIAPREDLTGEGIAMPRAGPVPVGGPFEALSYYYPPQVGAAGMMMGTPVIDPTLYGQQLHPYMPQQGWPQPPAQQQQQQQADEDGDWQMNP